MNVIGYWSSRGTIPRLPVCAANVTLKRYPDISIPVLFVIDSGADQTLLAPETVMRILVDYEGLKGQDAAVRTPAGEIAVFLEDLTLTFVGESDAISIQIEAAVFSPNEPGPNNKSTENILGRDVLSRCCLTLDDRSDSVTLDFHSND